MTFQLGVFLAVLGAMIGLFLSGVVSFDLVALVSLVIFVTSGLLSSTEAFSGFASPTTITIVAMFFVSGALRRAGFGEKVAQVLGKWGGQSEWRCVVVVMLAAAVVSALMNNLAAASIMLPAVMALSQRSRVLPSKLLIPLASGTILGGTCTLLGTPINMMMSDVMRQRGMAPLELFSVTPVGVVLVLVGVLAMALVGRHLLPSYRSDNPGGILPGTLPRLYRLFERLFALRIPQSSSLHGVTLGSIRFGELLGVQVAAIVRAGRRILSPQASEMLERQDLLIVEGKLRDLDDLRRLQELRCETVPAQLGDALQQAFVFLRLRVRSTLLQGRTLADCFGRHTLSYRIVGFERAGEDDSFGETTVLRGGDDLWLVVSRQPGIEGLVFDIFAGDAEILMSMAGWEERLFLITLPRGSEHQVTAQRFEELTTLRFIARCDTEVPTLFLASDVQPVAGRFLVSGDPDETRRLLRLGELQIESENVEFELESREVSVLEVLLSPRSQLIGQTLKQIDFRERFGFQVLAVWREGDPMRSRLARRPLRLGDALLLQGPRHRVPFLSKSEDFVLLSEPAREGLRTDKLWVALLGLLVMLAGTWSGVVAVELSAVLAALIVVVGGALSMEEAYREVEWRIVMFVGAILPLGMVFERSGAGALLSSELSALLPVLGPTGILVVLVLISSVLSQLVDAAVSIVVLGPLALALANGLAIDPHPFLYCVLYGASLSFLTPFSSKTNLLVMGAGGYRPHDFFWVGLLLTATSLVVIVTSQALNY